MVKTNCWQFIVNYYNDELGITLRPYVGKVNPMERNKLEQFLLDYLYDSDEWEQVLDPKYPDIGLFVTSGFKIHGVIILDNNSFLHMRKTGSLVTTYTDILSLKDKKFTKLVGYFHYKGLDGDLENE